jgi:hypothetical protein
MVFDHAKVAGTYNLSDALRLVGEVGKFTQARNHVGAGTLILATMGTPIGLEAFRALERGMQVQALEDAACIGTAVHKHHVAQYYAHEDFFVVLCSTKCGIDFTLVFRDGNEYSEMLWAIRLNKLPKPVKP